MSYLVDTSILGRLANKSDSCYATALNAVSTLHAARESLHIAPQNLVEFRNFGTRPTGVNGLGLLPATVEALSTGFESAFSLLPETPDIFPTWKNLVRASGTIGKQVHDARLVAICQVHQITHILTFNVQHFQVFCRFAPGITVVDPAVV